MKPRADATDGVIGRNVAAARTTRGVRRGAVAKAVGVTVQQYQKYETGGSRISASRLVRIAEVLGVPISDLFAGTSRVPDQRRMPTSRALARAVALLRVMPERQQKLALDALTIIAGTAGAISSPDIE